MRTKLQDSYSWVQLAVRRRSGETIYGDFAQLHDENTIAMWRQRFGDVGLCYSIRVFTEPNTGARYVVPLYLRVCSEHGIDAARRGMLEVNEQVLYMMQCCVISPQLYFDGEDGFDLLVPFEVFDAFYSPWVFALYAQIAQQIGGSDDYVVDSAIYTQDHLWQLPGSRGRADGLYKVHLTQEEMKELSSEEILALASLPHMHNLGRPEGPDKYAPAWYKNRIDSFGQNHPSCPQCKQSDVHRNPRLAPCIAALESEELPDGTRHATYCLLASAYAGLNMHYPQIMARLTEIDARNPIRDPNDIVAAAEYGCRHSMLPCYSELRRYCPPGGCELANSCNS